MTLDEALKKSENGIAVRNEKKIFHYIHKDGRNYRICQGQVNTSMSFGEVKKKEYTDWAPFNIEYILKHTV